MRLLEYLRRHKKDDDRPYAIGGMAGILIFLILSVFSFSVVDHYLIKSGSLAAVISAVLVDLTNTSRSTDKLDGLIVSPLLTEVAQAKADDMAAKGYFAHVSPDGKDSWYWFKQAGYSFIYAGENLAVDFSDSADVENAWMNSPTHRANILNNHFTQIGIATAQGYFEGHPTTFVVQMFGTPAPVTAVEAPIRVLTTNVEPTKPAIATTKPIPQKLATTTTKVATASVTPAIVQPQTTILGTETAVASPAPTSPWWQHVLASPKTALQYTYYGLAVLLLVLLAFVTEFEFKRHHLHHVVAAGVLMVFMTGLFLFANFVLFTHPVLAAGL